MAENKVYKPFPAGPVRKTIERVLSKKVKKEWVLPGNHVDYKYYDKNKKLIRTGDGACFSSFKLDISTNKDISYFHYVIGDSRGFVSSEKTKRFIELGVQHGIIPSELIIFAGNNKKNIVKTILEKEWLINIKDKAWSPSRLYMMLSYMRYLKEASYSATAVVDLVDKGKRNFWASLIVSHYLWTSNSGHSVLPVGQLGQIYGAKQADAGYAISWRNYIHNSQQRDGRNITGKGENGYSFWKMHIVIAPEKKVHVSDLSMMLRDEVGLAIDSGSYKKLETAVKKLTSERV